MKKENRKNLCISICMLVAFSLWTIAIKWIDVQAIGPQNSSIGFATINQMIHDLTGVHMLLYWLTDWLGLIPIVVVAGFGILGLIQWIKRKHLAKVDYSILTLGAFYIIVMAAYILFEILVINYRPVLIDGHLEVSYPSSTTMLVMCVMPTASMQFNARIKNHILKKCIATTIAIFVIFMVVGRLISGVHWFTDIVGGALLSAGLVYMYRSISGLVAK